MSTIQHSLQLLRQLSELEDWIESLEDYARHNQIDLSSEQLIECLNYELSRRAEAFEK